MVEWKTVKIIPFRRTAKWLLGALVQEDERGNRRIKIFKGYIKENGKYSVMYKGEKISFSMLQRLNIPSKKYWEYLKEKVDALLREGESGETLEKWMGKV